MKIIAFFILFIVGFIVFVIHGIIITNIINIIKDKHPEKYNDFKMKTFRSFNENSMHGFNYFYFLKKFLLSRNDWDHELLTKKAIAKITLLVSLLCFCMGFIFLFKASSGI